MINIGDWKFRWEQDLMNARINCVLVRSNYDDSFDVFQPNGTILRLKHGEKIPEPSFVFEPEHLIAIMEGLWDKGVRPKARAYDDQMDFIKAHLADMRKLVFDKMVSQ